MFRLIQAIAYATRKHAMQRRKDAAQTPYINHPIAVMEELALAGYTDEDLLCAAVLHDTLEDTDATVEELIERFGPDVTQYVREVTDDKTLAWQERKSLQLLRAPSLSVNAKRVRIADKLCNVRDVLSSPPVTWPVDRLSAYQSWARLVVHAATNDQTVAIRERFDNVLKGRP